MTIVDSPFWVVHPVYSTNVIVRNINITSPHINNDGVDPESSVDVLIENSYIVRTVMCVCACVCVRVCASFKTPRTIATVMPNVYTAKTATQPQPPFSPQGCGPCSRWLPSFPSNANSLAHATCRRTNVCRIAGVG